VNFKFLILFILLLSISLYSVKTGWISSESMEYIYVTVVTTQVDITVTTDKDEYCPGELVNVSNNLTNIGMMNATGDFKSKILDPIGVELNSTNWFNIDLLVGESKIYNAYYTVQGTEKADDGYYANGTFSYDGKSDSSLSETFRIKNDIGTFYALPPNISQIISAGNFSDTADIDFFLTYACDNAIVTLNTTPGGPGDWVTFHPDEIFLNYTGMTNTTTVNISVPKETSPGIYNGTIYAYANGEQKKEIDLKVYVKGLTFSVDVTVLADNNQVCLGDDVTARIDVSKNQPGLLDINMTYQVTNSTGYVFHEVNTEGQINNSLQIFQTLTPPSILGYYSFFAILQHNQTFVTGSDTLRVIECVPPPPPIPTPGPSLPLLPIHALTLRLSTDILTVIRGNRTSFIAYVNNTGTAKAESIRLSIDGIPLDWIEVLPIQTTIPVGETREYLVFINVPEDAEIGIRRLEVKAKNRIESNVEVLILVIGRDPKEIADLLLLELERLRALANESLLVEECIEISMIKSYYEDAEFALERGLNEYELGNFVQAVSWFEYAIPVYIKVQRLIDMTLEVEIERLRSTSFITPPTFDQEQEYRRAKSYLDEKNYRKICEPISRMRTVMMSGLIFWPAFIVVVIVLVIIAVILYRKKRRLERKMTLEKVKKRLETTSPTHNHLYPKYTTLGRIKRFWRKEEKENQ
jgi:hypothetical protein